MQLSLIINRFRCCLFPAKTLFALNTHLGTYFAHDSQTIGFAEIESASAKWWSSLSDVVTFTPNLPEHCQRSENDRIICLVYLLGTHKWQQTRVGLLNKRMRYGSWKCTRHPPLLPAAPPIVVVPVELLSFWISVHLPNERWATRNVPATRLDGAVFNSISS